MRFGIVFLCSNNRWSYTDFLRNEAKMTPKIAPPISPPAKIANCALLS